MSWLWENLFAATVGSLIDGSLAVMYAVGLGIASGVVSPGDGLAVAEVECGCAASMTRSWHWVTAIVRRAAATAAGARRFAVDEWFAADGGRGGRARSMATAHWASTDADGLGAGRRRGGRRGSTSIGAATDAIVLAIHNRALYGLLRGGRARVGDAAVDDRLAARISIVAAAAGITTGRAGHAASGGGWRG